MHIIYLHVNHLIMAVIKCPIQKCSYQTSDESCELVCRLLDLHKVDHEKNSGLSKSVPMPNEPQLIRPSVDRSVASQAFYFYTVMGLIYNAMCAIEVPNITSKL